MLKNFFPNKILSLSNTIINSLILLLVIVVIIGLIYSLLISPPDYIQGDSVRIMYVHVPSSFMALGCFGFIGLASICNLIFKIKFMSLLAKRLTSMTILLFFYIAYILTWKMLNNFDKANNISSIIGIAGLLNIPVIKYSVDWWSTLHQPSSITLTSAPTIHYSMLVPLVIMFFGMLIYTLIIFLMRYKTEVIKFKIEKKKNYK